MSKVVSVPTDTFHFLLAYNKERNVPTYVIYKSTNDELHGVSAELVKVYEGKDLVQLKRANGDLYVAAISEIKVRIAE